MAGLGSSLTVTYDDCANSLDAIIGFLRVATTPSNWVEIRVCPPNGFGSEQSSTNSCGTASCRSYEDWLAANIITR